MLQSGSVRSAVGDAAFNGLLPHIKDKYASQEFESISQIASRMTGETQSYEFGRKEHESYGFDITKADKIFDLLLSEGLIKLKPYHKIPSEEELKNMKYYKWHNAMSHDTNECTVC